MSPRFLPSLGVVGLLLTCAARAQGQAVWSQLPPPNFGAAYIVADSVRHRVVLFGGQSWALSLDSGQWTDLRAVDTPAAGTLGAAVVDPDGDRILFVPPGATGEEIQQLPLGVSSPVWSTLVTQGTPPQPIFGGMVYDRGGKRLIAWSDVCHTCVYQLSLTTTPPTWSSIAVTGSGGPQIRTAIYDPVRNRIVGLDASALPWALPLDGGGSWSRIFPVGTPPPGGNGPYSLAYDPIGDRILTFARSDATAVSPIALWSLTLASPAWEMLAVSSTPGVPAGGRCVYDPVGQQLVIYSGVVDTYRLNGPPVWTRVSPLSDVRPQAGVTEYRTVLDPVRDRILWFENYTYDNGRVPRLWERPLSNDSGWNLLTQSGSQPPGLVGSAIVYDPPRDRFLYFGGNTFDPEGVVNDVWALDPTTVRWTHLSLPWMPPPPRAHSAAAYDPVRDRFLFFGGDGAGRIDLNDVWSLAFASESGLWSHLTPSGTPPTPRHGSFLAYDPRRDEMLLFGGSGNQDAWVLSLGDSPAWTILSPSGIPGVDGASCFDPVRDRLIANLVPVSALTGQTAWTKVPTTGGGGSNSPGQNGKTALDALRDRWIVSGTATLSFGGTALPSIGVPTPAVWTPGVPLPLTYRIRNPYPSSPGRSRTNDTGRWKGSRARSRFQPAIRPR